MKKLLRQMRFTLTIARYLWFMLPVLLFALETNAQTTLFTFQNTLPNEITPATGTFEMEFKLFNTTTSGTQIGVTNSINEVEVKNRAFSVSLDFGAEAFSGADRFIEVSVRRSGSSQSFTTLTPRTQILPVPYAIRALNATTADNALNVNGVDVNDFVLTTDVRLSDSRDPNPGSANYIQNRKTQQAVSNFNISGNGTLGGALTINGSGIFGNSLTVGNGVTAGGIITGNIVNAAGQFNINGNQILTRNSFDLFNTTANFGYQQRVTDAGGWRMTDTNGNPLIVVTPSGNVVIGSFFAPSNSAFDVEGTIGLTSPPQAG